MNSKRFGRAARGRGNNGEEWTHRVRASCTGHASGASCRCSCRYQPHNQQRGKRRLEAREGLSLAKSPSASSPRPSYSCFASPHQTHDINHELQRWNRLSLNSSVISICRRNPTCLRAGASMSPSVNGSRETLCEIIDGKKIAETVLQECSNRVNKLREEKGRAPELAVLLVGDRKDSATYVRMKHKACTSTGIVSHNVTLPAESTTAEVVDAVKEFNDNDSVDGILVQMPLPDHVDEEQVLAQVSISKDVDGFHPINIGKLSMRNWDPSFVPCTPRGCIELLKRSGVTIEGSNACVVGRSNIVGMPVAMLLQKCDATVTIVHSKTPYDEMVSNIRRADIVIAAAGRAEIVKGDWIKPGATVIDVGINPVEDSSKKRGYRLVGDVCYDEAVKVAGRLTPVPGGVGPMTIAMLMLATVESAERRLN